MTPVSRSGGTTFTTPSDREVQWTRVFDAPRRLVFDAWTNPKHIPNWMLGPEGWTMPVCEVDLRPGGTWLFVWRKADGSESDFTWETGIKHDASNSRPEFSRLMRDMNARVKADMESKKK